MSQDPALRKADHQTFLTEFVHKQPGWLEDYAAIRTMELLGWQQKRKICGPLLEIGVFHARYFSLMIRSALHSSPPDRVVGVDSFQYVSVERVKAAIEPLCDPETVPLLKILSANLSASDLLEALGGRPRFISIDGSHDCDDVFWDFRLAEEILSAKGLISADDFLNPLTMGVTEAINRFFATGPRNLAPVAFTANKLFLARPSFAQEYRDAFESLVVNDELAPQSVDFRERATHGRHHVEQRLWGHPVLIAP